MKNIFRIIILIIAFGYSQSLFSDPIRIAVLPFENMDGKIDANVWCYDLQDSVYKALKAADPNGEHYEIVSPDEIEDVLAELNLDPSNPQYKSDVWKAIKLLKVKKVVMGNFNIQADKFLINCYIYDAKMKLPDPDNKIRDIFKTEAEILSAVAEIVEALLPGLIKK